MKMAYLLFKASAWKRLLEMSLIFCKKCGKETEHRLALVWLNKEWETYVCEVEGCNISVAIPVQEVA